MSVSQVGADHVGTLEVADEKDKSRVGLRPEVDVQCSATENRCIFTVFLIDRRREEIDDYENGER